MSINAVQIRGARAMLGMLQQELAEAAGLSQRALAAIEIGESKPRRGTLEKLQAVLEAAGAVFIETDTGVGVLVTSKSTAS
jgi:transcriptional regulator with XRE-family HTH domain